MYQDRSLAAAAAAAPQRRSGLLRRIGGSLGLLKPPIAEAEPETADADCGEPSDLEKLATMLAQLIGTAQQRVDGAVRIVGRSADEAEAYRVALAESADRLGAPEMPGAVAAALVDLTRAMIARTRGAEARLHDMGAELAALQRDLAEARTLAERDPLTGLPNRRAMEAALGKAVAAAQAAETALSLAFCDIDQFKRLNDLHGHAVGDRVLRHVADCLADGMGEDGLVARFGGEEFVMLLDGVDRVEAVRRVDGIRERLVGRMLRSRTDERPLGSVSFSAGVAEMQHGETAESLLERADRALYRAKEEGRNRVVADGG